MDCSVGGGPIYCPSIGGIGGGSGSLGGARGGGGGSGMSAGRGGGRCHGGSESYGILLSGAGAGTTAKGAGAGGTDSTSTSGTATGPVTGAGLAPAAGTGLGPGATSLMYTNDFTFAFAMWDAHLCWRAPRLWAPRRCKAKLEAPTLCTSVQYSHVK